MQSSSTRDVHVMDTQPLITPIELIKEIPLSDKAKEVVLSGREQLRKILDGQDDRMLVVAGPCSIHNEESALEYASQLVELSKKVSDPMLIGMRV